MTRACMPDVLTRWSLLAFHLVHRPFRTSLWQMADMDEGEEMPTEQAPVEEATTEGAASNMEDVD